MTRSELAEETAKTVQELNTEIRACIVNGHVDRAAGFAEALRDATAAYIDLTGDEEDD